MTLLEQSIDSPLGTLRAVATDAAVVGLYLPDHAHAQASATAAAPAPHHAVFSRLRRELAEYFAGERTRFTVPLEARGTDFQSTVWRALLTIPYGETISYAELAARVGAPRAVRAVGSANARNPISILVPCHRVIGKDGALRGYAGGEARKAWLLEHERVAHEGDRPPRRSSRIPRGVPREHKAL